MAFSMVTNVAALGARRNLANTQRAQEQTIGRLSSGLRINRAGDDAAGLGISENLRADIRSLSQAQRNADDGVSLTQVAEGALNAQQGIVVRMRELAVQAANGTLGTTERGYISTEFKELRSEIDRISNVTEFNGQKLVDGSLGSTNGASLQVGIQATTNDRITLTIATTSAGTLGNTGSMISDASLSSVTGAQNALATFDKAIEQLSTRRASIGATQNRLEITMQNLSVANENLSAANSRIRDVDVAMESSALVRGQILSQAGIAVLSQANQLPSAVSQLLR